MLFESADLLKVMLNVTKGCVVRGRLETCKAFVSLADLHHPFTDVVSVTMGIGHTHRHVG